VLWNAQNKYQLDKLTGTYFLQKIKEDYQLINKVIGYPLSDKLSIFYYLALSA